jgi:DNA-binding SARP family transcriptional activator/TolB-like protein
MLRLHVFGGVAVERSGVSVAETAELQKPLALLVLVAASRDRGVSRDQLAAYLWPESHSEHARAALSQTLYTLRKQLAEPDLFVGTRTLRLNPTAISSELYDLTQALERDDPNAAIELYSGPFLEGFFVPGCIELERWIESERADFAQQWAVAIESLARRACERGDHATAARWWRRFTAAEPGNSRAVAALVGALAASGDRAGALQVAHSHQAFLRSEFDAPSDPAVAALVEEIRHGGGTMGAEKTVERAPRVDAGGNGHPPQLDDSLIDVKDTFALNGAAPPDAAEGRDSPTRASTVAVDQVDQSRRTRRWRIVGLAVVIGGSIAAIATAGLLYGRRTQRDAPVFSERRIAVHPFRNETGDTALASVGRLAVDWVVQGLAQTQLVEVVAPGVLEGNLPGLDGQARPPNAGLVVRGSYSRTADSLFLQAQIVESATGRVVRAVGPVSGPLREPLVAIERLRQRLAGALATRVDPRLSRWSDAASQPVSFEAYRAFDEGLTGFFSARNSAESARANRLLVHAAQLDTNFSIPLVWALYGFSNAGDPVRYDSVLRALESRRQRLTRLERGLLDAHVGISRGDAVAQYQAFRRVVAIVPNSEWVYKLATHAIDVHRYGEADSLLKALDPDAGWMREWDAYWIMRAEVDYLLGRHESELASVMHAAARNPEGVFSGWAGLALAALGRKAEFLSLLDAELASTRLAGSAGLFHLLSVARVHGHADIATAIADRALRGPVTTIDVVDSTLGRARFELLVFEATENWSAAVTSAKRVIRLDSLRGHHDALPYIVLLEAASQGAPQDTVGLEAKALNEVAARPKAEGFDSWRSENPLAVRAALAALHGDARRTAGVLQEAMEADARRDSYWYFKYSDRPAFDRVRNDPSLANLLHVPALDRRSP